MKTPLKPSKRETMKVPTKDRRIANDKDRDLNCQRDAGLVDPSGDKYLKLYT